MRAFILLTCSASLFMALNFRPCNVYGQKPGDDKKAQREDGSEGKKPTEPDRAKVNLYALRQAAMNGSGDPKRGKSIYLSTATRCSICHKVQGQGGDVGPDLSQIGGKFDRTHLIESILDPSAEIPQGYHATILGTKSGRVFT